jgi:hypothetical protein
MTHVSGGSATKRDSGAHTGRAARPAPWLWLFEVSLGLFLVALPTLNAWLTGSWRWYHWLGLSCGLVWLGVFCALRLVTRRSDARAGGGQDAEPVAPADRPRE